MANIPAPPPVFRGATILPGSVRETPDDHIKETTRSIVTSQGQTFNVEQQVVLGENKHGEMVPNGFSKTEYSSADEKLYLKVVTELESANQSKNKRAGGDLVQIHLRILGEDGEMRYINANIWGKSDLSRYSHFDSASKNPQEQNVTRDEFLKLLGKLAPAIDPEWAAALPQWIKKSQVVSPSPTVQASQQATAVSDAPLLEETRVGDGSRALTSHAGNASTVDHGASAQSSAANGATRYSEPRINITLEGVCATIHHRDAQGKDTGSKDERYCTQQAVPAPLHPAQRPRQKSYAYARGDDVSLRAAKADLEANAALKNALPPSVLHNLAEDLQRGSLIIVDVVASPTVAAKPAGAGHVVSR